MGVRMLGKEKREKSNGRACQGEEESRFKKGAGMGSTFRPVTSFRMPPGRYDSRKEVHSVACTCGRRDARHRN
jgi:hypothetical protein